MSLTELHGEHGGQRYMARLREQPSGWHLDSLFIGDLPSEVDEPSLWPTREAATAAVAQRVAHYVDEHDLHPTTVRRRGVPLGGG